MTLYDVSNSRLCNQQVGQTKLKTPKDLVSWMGAMQAQDYAMAKWAVGVRLPGTTNHTIEKAIESGEIIRTHVLRPTWHFVSAADAAWMLELTAPHIKSSLRSRHRQLELTPAIVKKCMKIIEKALSSGGHLTREELVNNLEKSKIATNDQRAAHILLYAELDQIICSGALRGKKNTYALFSQRITRPQRLNREEGLIKLIAQYFKSHGPATQQDLIWWSGLPAADAKKGIELIKKDFHSEKIGAQTYWFKDATPAVSPESGRVYLLPAFDEFIIGYTDRTACLPAKNQPITISNNGIFRPVVVLNGQVIGLWKRATVKNKIVVETRFFAARTASRHKNLRKLISDASEGVGDFFVPGIEGE